MAPVPPEGSPENEIQTIKCSVLNRPVYGDTTDKGSTNT